MRQDKRNVQLTATPRNGDTRRQDKNLSCRGQRHCCREFERAASGRTRPHTKTRNIKSLSRRGRCEGVPGHDRTKQSVEPLPGYHNRMRIRSTWFARAPGPGGKHSRPHQTNLIIIPDGLDRFPDVATDSTPASEGGPVRLAFDGEGSERVVECVGGAVKLFKRMAWSDGKP